MYYKEEEKKCKLKSNASHCYILCPIVLPLRYPSLRMRVRLCEGKLETFLTLFYNPSYLITEMQE